MSKLISYKYHFLDFTKTVEEYLLQLRKYHMKGTYFNSSYIFNKVFEYEKKNLIKTGFNFETLSNMYISKDEANYELAQSIFLNNTISIGRNEPDMIKIKQYYEANKSLIENAMDTSK
jgi:hypothetical protein